LRDKFKSFKACNPFNSNGNSSNELSLKSRLEEHKDQNRSQTTFLHNLQRLTNREMLSGKLVNLFDFKRRLKMQSEEKEAQTKGITMPHDCTDLG
jgi:hypothetical protein